jgi:hypothetical protein
VVVPETADGIESGAGECSEAASCEKYKGFPEFVQQFRELALSGPYVSNGHLLNHPHPGGFHKFLMSLRHFFHIACASFPKGLNSIANSINSTSSVPGFANFMRCQS